MILEVAKKLGYNPVKCGRVYRDKNHDSLIFLFIRIVIIDFLKKKEEVYIIWL